MLRIPIMKGYELDTMIQKSCKFLRQCQIGYSSYCFYQCTCLLYTSDAADEEDSVDLGGRPLHKKKKNKEKREKKKEIKHNTINYHNDIA